MKEMIISSIAVIIVGWFITGKIIKSEYEKTHSHQLLSYSPNVWTSLGILGTFISIIISLQRTTDFNDITKLISNISPAFVTSVVGIIGSIISSISIKKRYAREELEERMAYENETNLSSEIVLAKLLFCMEKMERNQSAFFENLFNKIDNSVNKGKEDMKTVLNLYFDEEGYVYKKDEEILQELKNIYSFTNTFQQKLSKSLDTYFKSAIKETNDATKKLINQNIIDYKKILTDSNTQIIESTTQHITGFQNALKDYYEKIGKNSEAAIESYKSIFEKTHELIVSDIKKEFEITQESYAVQCQKVADDCLAKTNDVISKMLSVIQDMQQKSDKINSLLSQHSLSISKQVENESSELSNLSKNITGFIQLVNDKLVELTQETKTSLANIQNEVTMQVTEKIKEDSVHLLHSINEFRQTLTEKEESKSAEIYQSFNSQIGNSVDRLSKALDKDSEEVKKLLADIEKTSEERSATLDSISSILNQLYIIQTSLGDASSNSQKAIEACTTASNNMGEKFAAVASKFDETKDSIYNLIYQINSFSQNESVEVVDGKKICPYCNTENEEDARFCTECGRNI